MGSSAGRLPASVGACGVPSEMPGRPREVRGLSENCERASRPQAHRRGLEPGPVRGAESSGLRLPFQGLLGRRTASEHPGCAPSRLGSSFPPQPLFLSSLRSLHLGRLSFRTGLVPALVLSVAMFLPGMLMFRSSCGWVCLSCQFIRHFVRDHS